MSAFWRLVPIERRAQAFSGEGAALEGGRWNQKGWKAVYLSDSLALAALEALVHLSAEEREGKRFAAFRVEVGGDAIESPARVPTDWRALPAPAATQALGTDWLKSKRAAGLLVPSIVVPWESNLMLNPDAPGFAGLRIAAPRPFSFDPRLWK